MHTRKVISRQRQHPTYTIYFNKFSLLGVEKSTTYVSLMSYMHRKQQRCLNENVMLPAILADRLVRQKAVELYYPGQGGFLLPRRRRIVNIDGTR